MPIESASYISQLVTTNPTSGDPVGNAADHLRLIKSGLVNSFANVNAAVTATVKQFNNDFCPVGLVAMWSGLASDIPASWGLCDGTTYAKVDGSGNITSPDLRDKFIVGAGHTYAIGQTGGAASNTPTIGGTSLSQAQLPSCNFTVTDDGHSHGITDDGHSHGLTLPLSENGGSSASYYGNSAYTGPGSFNTQAAKTNISINNASSNISVSSGGSGQTHNHICSEVPTLPPYYALAFIMKL